MRIHFFLAARLCLWPALAAAQAAGQSSGPEVMGVIAVGNLWDDESRLGFGVVAGAGGGYRWNGRLGVEGRVERFAHQRTFATSGVTFDTTGTRVLGQVAYYWSTGSIQPFTTGTFGVMKVTQQNEFPVAQPGPTGAPIITGTNVFESEHTDTVWGGSGGVRVRLHDRFALRPEAGILFSVPDNFIDIRFGVTAIVTW